MKKVISFILALTMVFALSVSAFAAAVPDETTYETTPQTNSKDVKAAYEAAKNEAARVYYFTIKWEANETNDLKFTGAQGVYKWSGSEMKYTKDASSTEDKWTGSAGYKITVTNQSNASIFATTAATNDLNLTLSSDKWTNEEFTTADAGLVTTGENGITLYNTENAGSEQAKSITYTYTANDTASAPAYTAESTITVGTITVTVKDTST